jgi:protein tyrosine phosphatase (PTP) superfamily phosphohydrolase (DUF442 family)
MHNLDKINNYYAYSEFLSAGGQPTPEQLKYLKEEGFELVINISPVSARNALHNEHQITEQMGMDYVHFPVDCSNLRPFHYLMTTNLLKSAEGKKTFMHCGANIKTSNLIHMYQVLEKKMNEQDSLRILLAIQQPEEKWFRYFSEMGMQGEQNPDKSNISETILTNLN